MIARFALATLLFAAAAHADDTRPPMLTPEEQKLADEATRLNAEGVRLQKENKVDAAIEKMRQALELRRGLYPHSKYPDGHRELALSLSNLGGLLPPRQGIEYAEQALAMYGKLYPEDKYPAGSRDLAEGLLNMGRLWASLRDADKSFRYYQKALAMHRKQYPPEKFPDGNTEQARILNEISYMLMENRDFERAEPATAEALAMHRKLYPASKYADGHPELAVVLNQLGYLHHVQGALEQASKYYGEALAIRKKYYSPARFPNGHPQLAISLSNVGALYDEMGALDKALGYKERAFAGMQRAYPESKFPAGHPHLATVMNNLATEYWSLGDYDKSLTLHERALAMRRKLYPADSFPHGHPELITSLNNLGFLLKDMGLADQAAERFQQALDYERKLYPPERYAAGHIDLALGLNNLAGVFNEMGQRERALPLLEQSAAMMRKLFPEARYGNGHVHLAAVLDNLGQHHCFLGDLDKALPLQQESLAMLRKLYPAAKYPDGHSQLAKCLANMGWLLHACGDLPAALDHLERHAAMMRRRMEREIAVTSESAALAYALAQLRTSTRDLYLTVAGQLPDTEAATYRHVWETKAYVTRVLERRHAYARAADSKSADALARLRDNRRRTERLLQDGRMPPEQRDRKFSEAAAERGELERELFAAVPILARWQERDRLGFEDLARLLPEDAVFIDLVRFARCSYQGNQPGEKNLRRTPAYAAFIVSRNRALKRVDLGDAAPIDRAIESWRNSIAGEAERSEPGLTLQTSLWGKLAPHVAANTKTLFVAPDGDLARLPWPALPVEPGVVLLEKFALALVPHGPFLLEQLKFASPRSGPDTLLAVGDLTYGDKAAALPGTAQELKGLAEHSTLTLRGGGATPTQLVQGLPKVRMAHLATHGFFDAEKLAADRKRAVQALQSRQFGEESRLNAANNPLGFTGLVLSGGEVFTGLSLVDLPLENLRLATLSACETGLGDVTVGEGVFGLTRAFHLAGCPNVVASLWKVNDAATTALMAKFYHEMWVNKKEPLAALRTAQLTIYHHPELIPDLAGERGAIKVKEAAAVKIDPSAKLPPGKKCDTKRWAAFVLSGVGK